MGWQDNSSIIRKNGRRYGSLPLFPTWLGVCLEKRLFGVPLSTLNAVSLLSLLLRSDSQTYCVPRCGFSSKKYDLPLRSKANKAKPLECKTKVITAERGKKWVFFLDAQTDGQLSLSFLRVLYSHFAPGRRKGWREEKESCQKIESSIRTERTERGNFRTPKLLSSLTFQREERERAHCEVVFAFPLAGLVTLTTAEGFPLPTFRHPNSDESPPKSVNCHSSLPGGNPFFCA